MSIHDKFNTDNHAVLEKMSTQELKDLLCQMSNQFTATEDESNAIIEIMEVLKIREDNSDYIRLDVNAALKTFREEFLPSAEIDPASTDDETDDEDEHFITNLPKKKNRSFAQIAGIAASIAIIIFTAGCLIPTANGSNLWSVFAQWTKETLGINTASESVHEEYPEQLDALYGLLRQHQLPADSLLPRYLPKGYEEINTICDNLPNEIVFFCQLQKGPDVILLQYINNPSKDFTAEFQKNDCSPEEIIIHDHVIYIVQNMDLYTATWVVGTVQCSIQSVSSHDEIVKMINSIYEE